jgi:hypothetical protein
MDFLLIALLTLLASSWAVLCTASPPGCLASAARCAFLATYDLPKEVYIFTAGAIGLAIDTGRLATYWWQGAQLDDRLL